ncbi:DUF5715 family protein [Telmatobacter bradus]|uniref:DUF5715 family protein n=1 Tax=Telmatobacter bradus TaxID=474953 RepID=UPI003B42A40C
MLTFSLIPGSATTVSPRPGHERAHVSTGSSARPQRHTAVATAPTGSSKRPQPLAGFNDGYRKGYAAAQADAARLQHNAVCKGAPPRLERTPTQPAAVAEPAVVHLPARHTSLHASARPAVAVAATYTVQPSRSSPFDQPIDPQRSVDANTLRGSYDSLWRQNERLEAEGLERIESDTDLQSRINHRMLVPLPASGALAVNGDLPPLRRYCRPWTAQFLADLARAHEGAFHKPIEVSSAVRTVAYQKRLKGTNGNAAPAEGDVVSPHLTGAAVDIAKGSYSPQELAWMRAHLLVLQQAGKIDVEEEFQQSCFHITVYKSYLQTSAPARTSDNPEEDDASATRPRGEAPPGE